MLATSIVVITLLATTPTPEAEKPYYDRKADEALEKSLQQMRIEAAVPDLAAEACFEDALEETLAARHKLQTLLDKEKSSSLVKGSTLSSTVSPFLMEADLLLNQAQIGTIAKLKRTLLYLPKYRIDLNKPSVTLRQNQCLKKQEVKSEIF